MALLVADPNAPEFTRKFLNLADARLGAKGLSCSDEFFAPLERMLNPEPAVFIPGKYDAHGKWMDGWETRRKRVNGEDWAIVQLARRGKVYGFDVDTSHFTGNYAPAISILGCDSRTTPDETTKWFPVLASTNLSGNNHHYLEVQCEQIVSHLKLTIYPDGGVARLRVYGQPSVDWSRMPGDALIDFAAAENGAHVMTANNQHFGLAASLLMPGRGVNMGDGWETRRRREPGNDWCVIALAHLAVIQKIEVDTCHFKGNYPDRCSIQASHVLGGTDTSIVTQCMFWPQLLGEQKLEMDKQHFFESQIQTIGPISHIRFNIFPDGGVSRLRLWGKLA